MEGQNYKQLFDNIKEHAKLELEYSKLTLAEKLSILLSRAIVVTILIIFGAGVMLLLLWAFAKWMIAVTGSLWVGAVIAIAAVALLALLVYGYRKQLIINPVTRFVTKLLLTPEE
ncbi:MAG: phage holin family protein [Muribaculaceae bacterium]|nr:phage holin family protein [Muribaculaceae bacterium]MBR5118054.1 phage holin family protein [Muribaculaceae bacterium]